MPLYVVLVVMGLHIIVSAAPPLRLEIDCGSHEAGTSLRYHKTKSAEPLSDFNVNSLCSVIYNSIPKSVKDGKFILIGEPTDQSRASNNQVPVTLRPPKGFVPKFRKPRIRVPKLKVPKLRSSGPLSAPRVGAHMFPALFQDKARERDAESSAERMEKLKKGVQKMLHVVKVLGQIDQYVSARTRSVIEVLSKTLAE